MTCAVTALIYPFNTLYKFESYYDVNFWIIIAGETIMLIDIGINFILAYKSNNSHELVTDLNKIGKRYIMKGNFMKDFIIWIPIAPLICQYYPFVRVFQIIKFVRFKQFIDYLEPKHILPIIREMFEFLSDKYFNKNESQMNSINDNVQILNKLIIFSIYNIFRFMIVISFTIYTVIFYWLYLCFFIEQKYNDNDFSKRATFFTIGDPVYQAPYNSTLKRQQLYKVNKDGSLNKDIHSLIYYLSAFIDFGLTTFATIGFGDYYPVSDFERILGIFLLFCEYTVFSLLMGTFIKVLQKFVNLDIEYEKSQELNYFFQMIQKFNKGACLNQKLRQNIIKQLEYKWQYSRNICLQTQQEIKFFERLPKEIQIQIFKNFLYTDFLLQFRRLFQFNIQVINQKSLKQYTEERQKEQEKLNILNQTTLFQFNICCYKFKDYPFYDWRDSQYQNFMIRFMRSLITRFFKSDSCIYKELEQVNEVIFAQKGIFNVGYIINNNLKKRLQFGARNIIGGYNVCFRKRSQYYFQAYKKVEGMAIKINKLLPLLENFPHFKDQFHLNVLQNYDKNIRRPLIIKKREDNIKYEQRYDYQHILYLRDDPKEDQMIRKIKNSIFIKNSKMVDDFNSTLKQQKGLNTQQYENNIEIIEQKIQSINQIVIDIKQKKEKVSNLLNYEIYKEKQREQKIQIIFKNVHQN